MVDIQVEAPRLTLETLDKAHDIFREEFPDKQERAQYEAEIDHAGGAFKTTKKVLGWLATSANKSRVMQARLDGFTYIQLPPYSNWENLISSARAMWKPYVATAQPDAVTRLAVRFVNRIELPRSFKDFSDYFRTFPQIGPDLPQTLSGMFARVLIPFDDVTASVTQLIDTQGITDTIVPVVLDIDVFTSVNMAPSETDVWETMETLRSVKNKVFFGSITDKAKELFQ